MLKTFAQIARIRILKTKLLARASPGAVSDRHSNKPAPLFHNKVFEAEKFESYLREEGLDRIIKLRKERGQSERDGSEIYSRCAKAIIHVGNGNTLPPEGSVVDRPLGFRLELIAQKSPLNLEPGSKMPVRVLHDGKPCEGVLVVAKKRCSSPRRGERSHRHEWRCDLDA